MEFTRTILEIIEVFFVSYLIGYAIILMSSIILGSVSIYERKRKKELNNIINIGARNITASITNNI